MKVVESHPPSRRLGDRPGRRHAESWGLPFPVLPTHGSQRFDPADLALDCDGSLARTLADASARLGLDVEIWLLTCWRALLWRLAGRREPVLGAVCDRHPEPTQRGAAERSTRMRSVRGAIDPGESFGSLAARIR